MLTMVPREFDPKNGPVEACVRFPIRRPVMVCAIVCGLVLLLAMSCSQLGPESGPEVSPSSSVAQPSVTPSPVVTPPSMESPTASWDAESARVEDILAGMTVEQKVGQLFMVHFNETFFSPDLEEMITEYHVGGIIIFPHNLASPGELASLVNDAQQAALASEPYIPLLVAADQEGWPILRLPQGATVFPSNMAVGATNSAEDARLMASVMSEEMLAFGINMNLAPVMDVNTNPLNPVIGIRSFGSSPELVARLGAAMIETYQSQGVVATVKHFPGHGDTDVDSHLDLPIIQHDMARLEAVELLPFRAAISAGVDCIMTAHINVPALDSVAGRPATLSPEILQGLLREQMGFEGIIATDSLSMSALMREYDVPTASAVAFQAGADLLLFGYTPQHPPSEQLFAYERVLQLVREGTILESRLDESVRRILMLKTKRGILDWEPPPTPEATLDDVGTPEHQAAASRVALDSITLVRDETNLLPLSPDSPLLVVYPPGAAGMAEAIVSLAPQATLLGVGERPVATQVAQAESLAQGVEAVIVATRDAWRYPEQGRLVEALAAQKATLAVALDSPYDLLAYPGVSTYLATYGRAPTSMRALAQVIFGLEVPKGRLPVDLSLSK